MSRWIISFETIDPKDVKGRWKTGVSEKLFRKHQRHGHEKSLARLRLVREVLCDATECLYRGWSRPDKDKSFIYTGTPIHDFQSLTIETPPPKGMVFMVFVLTDGTIDEWTWRKTKGGANRPEGVNGELIWSANQN